MIKLSHRFDTRPYRLSYRAMTLLITALVALYVLYSQFAAVTTEEETFQEVRSEVRIPDYPERKHSETFGERKLEQNDNANAVPNVSADKDSNKRSFTISGNQFLKDGIPFSFHAGTSHYWRRMPEYWEDTMIRLKAMGLNALETYVAWNLHEPEPEAYDFGGAVDIVRYIQLAQKHGLLVVLRPGPFINAEMVMGGLPYWLLRENPKMRLRTSDLTYMKFVRRWLNKLLPLIKPLLYVNGGPVIMVQIENEYGSYFACDREYLLSLRDLSRQLLGSEIVLFTTDGPTEPMLTCGPVEGALSTVDFGGGNKVSAILANYRKMFPEGPFVNSEFYPGWINHWGRKYKVVEPAPVLDTMKDLLSMNASFVVYPALGGTNFGFLAGPNMFREGLTPGTTSYDFNAPLNEAGDATEKFNDIRNVLNEFGYTSTADIPKASPKKAYGSVALKYVGTLFDNLNSLSPEKAVSSEEPMSFEELRQPDGFVMYHTVVSFESYMDPVALNISVLHDRALVFVDKKYVGILSRSSGVSVVNIPISKRQVLDILVQNEGRITAGPFINDSKGILGPVYLGNEKLLKWEHFLIKLPSYPVKNPVPLVLADPKAPLADDLTKPAFFAGTFQSSPAQNTFLDLTGWRQGYAFINGYNLGRYWPVMGPFATLFVPGAMLRESGDNILQLFELGGSPCQTAQSCAVKFVESHVITASENHQHKEWNFYNGH